MVETLKKEAKRPFGMILVTGPTGSGKTTTLYSILEYVKKSLDNKILTIEDPVEYQIAGISQVQAHPEIGLTFAAGLRSFLRHDPDVIMVGEIRDKETAEIAVRSALTGHLVLSTLHTNDAASTITRFIDMNIPPYLLTATINIIIAQRLVRKLCAHCKSEFTLSEADLTYHRIENYFKPGDKIFGPKGCNHCSNSGFIGRIPVFEWLKINENINKSVLRKESSYEIKELALKEKMPILETSGLELVKLGITSLDEIEKTISLGD
jgi:type II secretory ATPase GspE/PulE/Tfp pilus assembly ATPase PilB-like protein